jgi:hypothetical protein
MISSMFAPTIRARLRRAEIGQHHGGEDAGLGPPAITARPIPRRYWRRHGTGPLPTGKQALDGPIR